MGKLDIFAPQDNKIVSSLQSQKIMVYGGNRTGKTFQSTRMEKPALLMTEAGGNARNCPKFPITDWDDFTTVVKQFTSQYDKASKLYQTIIIDTAEELVALVEQKVAKRFGVMDVGMVQDADKNNPNGYSLARNMFKQQVNLLTKFGYTVVFLLHETEDNEYIDPITGDATTKIIPFNSNKEKGSTRFLRNLCDFIIYVQGQGIDPQTNEVIYSKALCKETKNVFAGSRYAIQTYINPFTAENLKEAIEKAITKTAKDEGIGLTEFKQNTSGYTKEDYFEMISPYATKIFSLYPDYVTSTVENELGEGRKITSATDDEITELGNIYSEFVAFTCDRGIVVEVE